MWPDDPISRSETTSGQFNIGPHNSNNRTTLSRQSVSLVPRRRSSRLSGFKRRNTGGSLPREEQSSHEPNGLVSKISNGSAGEAEFPLKSIHHGSKEWDDLIRLFVSDLVYRSLINYHSFQSEVMNFRPYTCHAAVLFIDLSNYSKITAFISHRGAHALSSIVNAYLSRILKIVQVHGGNVVKFAGDAVLVVWEGTKDDLYLNVRTAARCVMEMQEKAGSHPVDETDLCFQMHCGLCCGSLQSEIFRSPSNFYMQPLFHLVGGESIDQIGEFVDTAKAGEVCVSNECIEYLGCNGVYRSIQGFGKGKILTRLDFTSTDLNALRTNVDNITKQRLSLRVTDIDEDFIHPRVIQLLKHGGLSPTQIAQMRNLCVLFIAMSSNGSSANWLLEVQSILDKQRCPIVQIIDDDKGVHVIAAVNLYDTIPESGLAGLSVCNELVDQKVGCAIGMAQGSTFCGVTGCSSVACRWDITGPAAVRAARLMQFALSQELEVAIDDSVYRSSVDSALMRVYDCSVLLKGSLEPVVVYTLSPSTCCCAFRILDTVYGRVHDDIVSKIFMYLSDERSRCAVLVTGVACSGKKIVCQRAAGQAELMPYLHQSSSSYDFLQLARTIATWFRYVDNCDVNRMAMHVLEELDRNRWSRAHDECILLVNYALSQGLQACFVIDRVQFLDEFSISLLRECLHDTRTGRRFSWVSSRGFNGANKSTIARHDHSTSVFSKGKICFLCVHVSLYNCKTASQLVEDIAGPHYSTTIPIIEVGEARRDELRIMFKDLSDMEVEDRWLDAYAEASGLCAGYFIERSAAIRVLSGKLWSEGRKPLAETTNELVLYIPPGLVRMNKKLPVHEVSAEIATRFTQIFDELPPLFQMCLKILTLACSTYLYKLPQTVLLLVLNDLVTDGVTADTLHTVLDEMRAMNLLKVEIEKGTVVISFQNPALADIAFAVSTPAQIKSISAGLIIRLCPLRDDFRVCLVLASLHHKVNPEDDQKKELWREGYSKLLQESRGWSNYQINTWKECFQDEIRHCGYDEKEILDSTFVLPFEVKPVVGKNLPLLKIYSAPVSLGPMAHSLSVITRNTFHEYAVFHGRGDNFGSELRDATASACRRYLEEMDHIENFLSLNGYASDKKLLQQERNMMAYIATPAASAMAVLDKAVKILDEYVPVFVQGRLQRLYEVVQKVSEKDLHVDELVLRRAFSALRSAKSKTDGAQDALMILATMNWKPRPVPEYLPLRHYQTVARIRDIVFKRLSPAELFIYKHQQTILDLEAFLIVTPLLNQVSNVCRLKSINSIVH